MNKQIDIDNLEDLKEKIDEQAQEMAEKQDFFVRAGAIEDEDDLMDELNELEADMLAAELEDVEIGAGAVNVGQKDYIPAQKGNAKAQSEEDELRALEQMMA